MIVKYKSLKLFTLMSKQQKLLKNGISEYIKQENKKYAIVVYHNPFSAIVPYCPTTHNIMHTFRSFPNTA
jgi:hypothetical protein